MFLFFSSCSRKVTRSEICPSSFSTWVSNGGDEPLLVVALDPEGRMKMGPLEKFKGIEVTGIRGYFFEFSVTTARF